MTDTERCDCLSQEAQLDSDIENVSHIDSDLSSPNDLDSELGHVVEVSARYTGLEGDDIAVTVDNTNMTISARITNYAELSDLENIFGAERS